MEAIPKLWKCTTLSKKDQHLLRGLWCTELFFCRSLKYPRLCISIVAILGCFFIWSETSAPIRSLFAPLVEEAYHKDSQRWSEKFEAIRTPGWYLNFIVGSCLVSFFLSQHERRSCFATKKKHLRPPIVLKLATKYCEPQAHAELSFSLPFFLELTKALEHSTVRRTALFRSRFNYTTKALVLPNADIEPH